MVVHLAGENIGARRWTKDIKRRIWNSRVSGADLLVSAMARQKVRPKSFISASAISYYGDRGDELLYEEGAPGEGFLARLCHEWELAALKAGDLGVRVVCGRTGIVLSPTGGTLERMVPLFRWGLGGRLGSGRQYWSWIALDDLVAAYSYVLANEAIFGAINFVSPNPVTNAELTRALAQVVHRPAIFPAPAIMLRVVLGEMAGELVLPSHRVVPKRLLENGFTFAHPEVDSALRHVLRQR